jgi:hypothetical protein
MTDWAEITISEHGRLAVIWVRSTDVPLPRQVEPCRLATGTEPEPTYMPMREDEHPALTAQTKGTASNWCDTPAGRFPCGWAGMTYWAEITISVLRTSRARLGASGSRTEAPGRTEMVATAFANAAAA